MITVSIKETEIKMEGHACKKEKDGIDRVCAAISALTCNLINSIKDLTGDEIKAKTAHGMTMIKWERLSDKGKLFVDSWFLGIADINSEYNCIKFI